MIFTSYYANKKRTIPGVAISNVVPAWATNCDDWEPKLAPPWKMMPRGAFSDAIIGQAAWIRMFESEVLVRFNPDSLLRRFEGKAMLCYEKPGEFCHRRIVADWITRLTGVAVPEWGVEAAPPPDLQMPLL